MIGFWVEVLVAVIAGAAGAGVVLGLSGRRGGIDGTGGQASESTEPRATPCEPVTADSESWCCQERRCEQAVRRAGDAADSVSSAQARQELRSVVRRMGAELPNVRALVELGRGLQADSSDDEAVDRVRDQLDDAAVRFAAVTDGLVEAVVDHVAAPDLDRVRRRVGVLREQFPLLRPMSSLFGPGERSRPSRALVDLPG
jgi:hypothetical protein